MNKLVLAGFAAALVLSPSFAAKAEKLAAPVASQFRHGPDHLGVFTGAVPDISHQLWRFNTGGRIIASPVLAAGVVYVGSTDGTLYALDAKTGALRWHVATGAPVTASAAVANGIVIIQTDANLVLALDAADGHERWRHAGGATVDWHNFPAAPDGADWDYWSASPLVVKDLVVIGSGDSNIYALDAATGAEKWRFKTGSRVRATPASDSKRVYAGGFDGVMLALDLATGKKAWSFKTQGNEYFPVGEIQSSPALANGLVLFGSRDYFLYALDAKSGKPVWKNQHAESWVVGSPAVKDGRVYVGSSDAHFIRAVDLKTGAELWTKPVKSNVFSSPALVEGALFAGTFEGLLVQLDTATQKGSGVLYDERLYASPWAEDGVLYIGLNDGSVRALGAAR